MRSFMALAFISITGVVHAQHDVSHAAPERHRFDSMSLGSEKFPHIPAHFTIEPLSAPFLVTSTAITAADDGGCNRRCAVLRGAAIGLGVGAVGGALYGAHEDRTDNFGPSAVGIDAAVFAATGAFIGAITGAVWPLHSANPIVAAVVPSTQFRNLSPAHRVLVLAVSPALRAPQPIDSAWRAPEPKPPDVMEVCRRTHETIVRLQVRICPPPVRPPHWFGLR